MANFCPECGKATESADHKYCPECGQEMNDASVSSADALSDSSPPRSKTRKRWKVAAAGAAVVVLAWVAYIAVITSSGGTAVSSTETLTGVTDVVCMCEEKDDFCTFQVYFSDGTDRTYTSRDATFKVTEADANPESVEVTTITEYETGWLGLGETYVGERELYDFTLEPEDYEYYWSVQHAE